MQARELRRKENLEWNTNLIEMKKLENLICQGAQGLYSDSDVDSTGNRRDAAVAIDEVVEVLEPLEEAVSVFVEVLMSEALGIGERTADLS